MELAPLVGPMVAVALLALVLPFVLVAERRRRHAQVQAWRSVAERLGLRDVTSAVPLVSEPHLEGRVGPRRVRFERWHKDKYRSFVRVVIAGNSGVTLLPEKPARNLTKRLRQREIELGEEVFDAAVEIHGAPERVRALLDVETRGVVLRLLSGRVQLPRQQPINLRGDVALLAGDLRVDLPEQPAPPSPEELYEVTAALLAQAQRFHLPLEIPARLAAALAHEPVWRVRLQGLQLLSTGYPTDPATLAALRRAIADERPEIRLHAAIALGAEGRDTLLGFATDEAVTDAVAARAVHALGDRMPAEVASALLAPTLRSRRLLTAEACVHALGLVGDATSAGLLAKVLAVESGPLAMAAARALGTSGAANAEEALLRALERGLPELRLPAIEALGHVGSARAVLPIQEAATGAGADAEVRRAARQAVAEIQARLQGASPGQLSIAAGDAGRVSLADDGPRGRVSLPETR
jgi:HEAT repeat protein